MARPRARPERAAAAPPTAAELRSGVSLSEMLAERQVAGLDTALDKGLGIDLRAMSTVSNVHRVAMRIRHHFEQGVLRESGLTWTGFVVLWVLWIWGEMQTRWLAEEVDVNRSTLTGVLNTLERRGLVARKDHETEGRLVIAELTPAGEALIEDLFPRFNAEEVFVVSGLSGAEQDELAASLRVIHGLLDAEGPARRRAQEAED